MARWRPRPAATSLCNRALDFPTLLPAFSPENAEYPNLLDPRLWIRNPTTAVPDSSERLPSPASHTSVTRTSAWADLSPRGRCEINRKVEVPPPLKQAGTARYSVRLAVYQNGHSPRPRASVQTMDSKPSARASYARPQP